jgi:hypothetical protein
MREIRRAQMRGLTIHGEKVERMISWMPAGRALNGGDMGGSRTASPASRHGCRFCFPKASARGRITLNQFVALTSTNHAKTYGLTNKGSIAIGYDADIAQWNSTRTATLAQANLHHGADYTSYEGIKITARRSPRCCADNLSRVMARWLVVRAAAAT